MPRSDLIRPAMQVSLPDFSDYKKIYVVSAIVETSRSPVTLVTKLVQHKEYFDTWSMVEDDLTGERGGHTLRRGSDAWRLLQRARSFIRIDTHAELKRCGWVWTEMTDMWTAPLSVWKNTLLTIQDGGW